MKVKWNKKIILLLVASVSALLLVGATRALQERTKFKREFEPGTLPRRAQELKKRGIKEERVEIYTMWPVIVFDDFIDLMKTCDATVLATLVDRRYRLAGDASTLETVGKFRVDELLAGKLVGHGRGDIPAEQLPAGAKGMGPLRQKEILVLRPGGFLEIEGVMFRQGEIEYPPFRLGSQYLLFLEAQDPVPQYGNRYGNAKVSLYYPAGGPYGVLVVKEDSPQPVVKPLTHWPKMEAMLEFRFGSRKDFFVDYLRRMVRGALELAGGQGKALL